MSSLTKAGRDGQPTRKDSATQLLNREALSFATRPCTTVRNSECQLLEGSGWVVIKILKSRRHEHIWFVSCGEIFILGGWVLRLIGRLVSGQKVIG